MKKIIFFSSVFFILFFPGKILADDQAQLYNDLKVESFVFSPAHPAVNQTCLVTVKVSNAGTQGLFSSLGVGSFTYNFDNFQQSSFTYDTPAYDADKIVPSGGYVNYYFTGKFTKIGTNNLSFAVNTKREMIEEKIVASSTVQLYGDDALDGKAEIIADTGSDLVISSSSVSQDYVLANQPVTITFEVKNIGQVGLIDDAAFHNDAIRFKYDDFYDFIASSTPLPSLLNPMEPNGTVRYMYTGSFRSAGQKNISFTVNKDGNVKETNTNNNTGTISFMVYMSQEAADDYSFTAPTINAVSSSSITVSFTTSKEATSSIGYGTGDNVNDFQKVYTPYGTTHSVVINSLAAGTGYKIYIVTSRGNVMKSDEKRWLITTPLNDATQFTKEPKAAVSGNSVSIAWGTNILTMADIYYKKNNEIVYKSISTNVRAVADKVSLAELGVGNYTFYVSAKSSVDTSATSSVYDFTIADKQSPLAASATSTTAPATSTAKPAITPPKEIKKESEGTMIVASGKDPNVFLSKIKRKKSTADQNYAMKKYTNALVKGVKVTAIEKNAVNNFIVYGTASNQKLNAVKRFEVLKSYKSKFKKLPTSAANWNTAIDMAKNKK